MAKALVYGNQVEIGGWPYALGMGKATLLYCGKFHGDILLRIKTIFEQSTFYPRYEKCCCVIPLKI